MPRMITDIVAGVVMYGNFIAFGYVPKEEQSDRGEKYYIQITAPNLNSYKARLTDEAYQQFQQCLQKLGDNAPPFFPVLMNVSYSLFNGQVYWRAESFFLRPDNQSPFARLSANAAPNAAANASANVKPSSGSGSGAVGK